MNVLITGGTGLIGSALVKHLLTGGFAVSLLVRRQEHVQAVKRGTTAVFWNSDCPDTVLQLQGAVEAADVVINLAGENLFRRRWSPNVKDTLTTSRLTITKALVEVIRGAKKRPELFISASAVGYYGDTGDTVLDETAKCGTGFLAELCEQWEHEAQSASDLVRLAIPRIGIVLSKGGGALQKIALPYRFFVGTYPGIGKQWFPWVHIDDLVRALVFPIERQDFSGVYNVVAPELIQMKDFCDGIGRALRRPAWNIGIPPPVLRLALGEAAGAIVTGQKVQSVNLTKAGFTFLYPEIEMALTTVL